MKTEPKIEVTFKVRRATEEEVKKLKEQKNDKKENKNSNQK